jgi:hypothetical protein
MHAIPFLLLFLPGLATAQHVPTNHSVSDSPQKTLLFVNCGENGPEHVLGPVSVAEDHEGWRAYVEVDVPSGCLHTTRLWVARPNEPYRLVYLMPPKRDARGNGMEILGWARHSILLLVRTEQWQYGSDAPFTQQVLAIDAGTGMVYEPALEAMLGERKDKQCWFRVTDAGHSAGRNVEILVRAQFFTAYDEGDTREDVPPAKRCENTEETWSFSFATGEIKQVPNTEPLHLFKKFLPNRRDK